MTWIPLLLADPSPSLRLLVLRELLNRPVDDPEVVELKKLQDGDPILKRFLALQNPDGSFRSGEGGAGNLGAIRLTAQALMGLGYLGLDAEHPTVRRGAEYLFAQQLTDGAFPIVSQGVLLDGGKLDEDTKYHMIPLQTALPLLGLAWAGYAEDARAENAYEWLLAQELPSGGWPSGSHAGQYIFAGGYRRLAGSQFGCRTNTTAAVAAFALHPERRSSRPARRGLDLLLAHEGRQSVNLGFEVARLIGFEPPRGAFTYFKHYDSAQMLDLAWRCGAGLQDLRLEAIVAFVKGLQGPYGLWEYQRHPEASRWISFDILRSLSRLDESGDWISLEPRIPFRAYPKRQKRY